GAFFAFTEALGLDLAGFWPVERFLLGYRGAAPFLFPVCLLASGVVGGDCFARSRFFAAGALDYFRRRCQRRVSLDFLDEEFRLAFRARLGSRLDFARQA